MAKTLGIDIGGSAIKYALVDTRKGILLNERVRIPNEGKLKPSRAAEVIDREIRALRYHGKIGIGFPAVVRDGVAMTAANVSNKWIGININELISSRTGNICYTLNDADAAGIAEMRFGAGKEFQDKVVLVMTLGTGIGTAFFINGHLFPNTELGHLPIRGKAAEKRASDVVRQEKKLSWKKWAGLFQEYLDQLEFFFSPDVIIIGGGASKHSERFFPLMKTSAKLIPAMNLNQAGIIGAAFFADQK